MAGQDRVARKERKKIHLILPFVSLRRLSLLRSIGGDRAERSVWIPVCPGHTYHKE